MRPALFWEITQRVVAILTDVSGQPKLFTLEYVADRLSRNVGKNDHYTPRNFAEERRSQALEIFVTCEMCCSFHCVLDCLLKCDTV